VLFDVGSYGDVWLANAERLAVDLPASTCCSCRTGTGITPAALHLAGTTVEDRIEPTVKDLTDLVAPRIVAPGHCTGWRAAAALASAFSTTRYAPSVVGTRYLLNAS
jgi:metal-dependent hydrolase (beta-lactamase superfamily II)